MTNPTPIRLTELKQKVYRCWYTLHRVNDALCPRSTCTQDEVFKREIRSYGDLRFRKTWEQAFAVLKAKLLFDSNDDNQFLIEFHLIKAPYQEGWQHLVAQVVDQFTAIPGGVDCLMDGFEQISRYGSGYDTTVKGVEELAYATQTSAIRRCSGATAGFRHLPSAVATAATR